MSGGGPSDIGLLVTPTTGCPGDGTVDRIRARLVERIAAVMEVGAVMDDRPPGVPVEVTLPGIRRVRTRPETAGLPGAPFAWKPEFVRRSLGLAAVRACVEGRFRGPAAAVGPLAEAAVDEWRLTGCRTYHWEPWFAGLGPGGRGVVLAEAVTWATPLWAAFDWSASDRSPAGPRSVVFGADDRWTCPAPCAVRLKGRSEVRVSLGGPVRRDGSAGPGGPSSPVSVSGLVSVSGGFPGDGWEEELGYLALVAGLRPADRPVPARVLGLWPEAGERRIVETDEDVLVRAVDLVVDTVAAVVGGRTRWRPARRGAGRCRRRGPASDAVGRVPGVTGPVSHGPAVPRIGRPVACCSEITNGSHSGQ